MRQWLQAGIETRHGVSGTFDLKAWRAATSLQWFGVELRLRRGSARIVLTHVGADGQDAEPLEELALSLPGSAFSQPLHLLELEGLLRPELVEASEDADFDLLIFTDDAPLLPEPRLCQVTVSNDAGQASVALVLPSDTNAPEHDVIRLPARPLGALGLGVYHLLYDSALGQNCTHVCLHSDDQPLTPELAARLTAMLRFLRPGRHLKGHEGWCCLSMADLHEAGLPWPGHDTDLQEYGDRLSRIFGPATQSTSLATVQDHASQRPPRHDPRRTLLLALRDRPDALINDQADEVDQALAAGDIGHARAWITAMDELLKGPENLIAPPCEPAPMPSPGGRLARWQLRRQQRGQAALFEARRSNLTARLADMEPRLSGPLLWSRIAEGEADIAQLLVAPSAQIATFETWFRRFQSQLADTEARLRKAASDQSRLLDARLTAAGVGDPNRARADLDRSNLLALSALRGIHAGRRCVIIGNGPSLQIPDLDRLRGEITFASNKIFLAYDETEWRPTYYSVEDSLVMQNNREQIEALSGSFKIFPANMRDFDHHAADTLFIPFLPPRSFKAPLDDPDFPGFSFDLTQGICWGSTIVYSQIQMAMHMGCSEIVLIGLDHYYHLPARKEGAVYVQGQERNHFHPDYRQPGELWHQPNIEVLEVSYARAGRACAQKGVAIRNASRVTHLNTFERVNFDDLFPPTMRRDLSHE